MLNSTPTSIQANFDTRDIKKKSAPFNPTNKPQTVKGTGSKDQTVDDVQFTHQEINDSPGKCLERIRNEVGISRHDLAQKLAIKESIIGQWENGQTQLPGPMKSRIESILKRKLQ